MSYRENYRPNLLGAVFYNLNENGGKFNATHATSKKICTL